MNYIRYQELKRIYNKISDQYNANVAIEVRFVEEIDCRISEYVKSLNKPSEYKLAASSIFWIRKLKPAHFVYPNSSNIDTCQPPVTTLNELAAILYGISYLNLFSKKGTNTKPIEVKKEFLVDFATQLRYSSFSPSSISFIMEMLSS